MKKKIVISVLVAGFISLCIGGSIALACFADHSMVLIDGVIPKEQFREKGHVALDEDSETNAFTLVYDNQDGSKTLYVFSSPVQYEKDGRYTLIDNTLAPATDGYCFVNEENDIKTYYPDMSKQTDFLIQYGDVNVTMQALHNACEVRKTENKTIFDVKQEMVRYYEEKNITISYYTTNLGLKCQIEIDKPVENLSFDFRLQSDLTISSQNNNYYTFRDVDHKTAALLYQPVVLDKHGVLQEEETAFIVIDEQKDGDANAHLSITPTAAKEQYPLTLEFTLNMYKGNQVDSSVRSVTPNENQYLSNMLLASSVQSYGQAESYVRFEDSLLDTYVSANKMQSAEYQFYGLAKKKQAGLELYQCDSHWTSTKITWNTRQPFDTKLADVLPEGNHAYKVDVTDLVRLWPDDPFKKDFGFLIRAKNGQAETFASGDNGAMMPRLAIDFINN